MTRAAVLPAAAALLIAPASAQAHGLGQRADVPLPLGLFAGTAVLVLALSFLALALLWHTPQLSERTGRAVPAPPGWLDPLCGALGVAGFVALVACGLLGSQEPGANLLPTAVYVVLWVLVPVASALAGDVFRPLNPWRALGRLVARRRRRTPRPYPERLGAWPAVAGLLAFGWLELVAAGGERPATLAWAALAYAAVQLAGMARYGVEPWTARGDAFAVYFGLFARMAPVGTRDGRLVLRRPLSGLSAPPWPAGAAALVCTAIGITAFDGASTGTAWNTLAIEVEARLRGLGLDRPGALELTYTLGLLLAVALVGLVYTLGIAGLREREGGLTPFRWYAGSLVPIALAYVVAHYFSFAVFQGQALPELASDPAGRGWDLLGGAGSRIDYDVLSARVIWSVQAAALVCGHVIGLVVAHDRALVANRSAGAAVRSQLAMLAVMVAFTTAGLWLLSAANG